MNKLLLITNNRSPDDTNLLPSKSKQTPSDCFRICRNFTVEFGTLSQRGKSGLVSSENLFKPSQRKDPYGTILSLRASSPGRSGGGAGKGRRACNYVSGIQIPPPAQLWLPVVWGVRFWPISANRKRAFKSEICDQITRRTSQNVNSSTCKIINCSLKPNSFSFFFLFFCTSKRTFDYL